MRTKTIALLLGLLADTADAETLRVSVVDNEGAPVAHAAVYALPATPQPSPNHIKTAIIDQIDKEFVNHFSVVQTGTPVLFPNHDKIRHHVYSFSEAKTFELPLYQGTPAKPVMFDKPGVITLGCNIHDWMSAYVLVVDTPYFVFTNDQGVAELDLPAPHGYTVTAWHPQLKKLAPNDLQITLAAHNSTTLAFTMRLKKSFQAAIRLPAESGMTLGYR